MVFAVQIEEDTDRDRYMSPLEAKKYGLIDEVIGGDEAGFQITGTTRDFPKTKEAYVNWVSLHAPSWWSRCHLQADCMQGRPRSVDRRALPVKSARSAMHEVTCHVGSQLA